jgi:Leucine-rich repeat (LRR) protein
MVLAIGGVLALIMIYLAVKDYETFKNRSVPHEDYKSSIISLGIFGTFFGIIAGLWNFDSSDIEASVPPLLDGLKTAFLTSFFGMGVMTLLGVIQKKGEVEKESSETELVLKSLYQMNQKMERSQKIVSDGFQDLVKTITDTNYRLLENLTESNNRLSKNVADNLEKLSQGITDSNNKLIQNIENSNAELSDKILENGREISEKLNTLGSINRTQDEISKQIFSINAYSTHLENIDGNVSELLKMILKNAMKLKINENSEYWTKIFNEMASVSEELEKYKKLARDLQIKLDETEKKLAEIEKNSGENVSELQRKLELLQKEFSDLENEKNSIIAEKEKQISELLEKIKKLEKEIENCSKVEQKGNGKDSLKNPSNSELEEITEWSNRFGLGLPKTWKELQELKEIKARVKEITYIPEAIGNLSNLTSLYFDGNQITEIPEAIGNLSNLTELDFRDNQISDSEKEKIRRLLPNTKIDF